MRRRPGQLLAFQSRCTESVVQSPGGARVEEKRVRARISRNGCAFCLESLSLGLGTGLARSWTDWLKGGGWLGLTLVLLAWASRTL